jgi:fructuronate reductase
MIAAWLAYLSTTPAFQDPLAADIKNALTLEGIERTAALMALLDAELAGDSGLVARLDGLAAVTAGSAANISALNHAGR